MAGHSDRTSDILEAVALLVVDMQPAVLKVIPDAEALTARCGLAIEMAQTCGLKVIFTEQVPDKLGGTDPRLLALAPKARVFAKPSFSALQADGLQDHLKKHGIYHLLLTGIETPVCVYQTALHAIEVELDVTVLTDCVAGRRNDDCRVVLESLARSNCHLLPAEAVFYSMLATSSHPEFRVFTELVKRYSGPAPFANQGPCGKSLARKPPSEDSSTPTTPAGATRTRRGGRRRKSNSKDAGTTATAGKDFAKQLPDASADETSSPAGGARKSAPRRRRGGKARRRAVNEAGSPRAANTVPTET